MENYIYNEYNEDLLQEFYDKYPKKEKRKLGHAIDFFGGDTFSALGNDYTLKARVYINLTDD